MFTFYADSRSQWRKSFERARQLVPEGKMTRDEFVAAALPSPDARDPEPVAALDKSLQAQAEAIERGKVYKAEQERRATERQAKIAALRNEQVWALSGFYMEEMTEAAYTLAELEDWADGYGYVFAGTFGGSPTVFSAVAPAHDLNMALNHDVSADPSRRFSFGKAATHLRGWIAERRSR